MLRDCGAPNLSSGENTEAQRHKENPHEIANYAGFLCVFVPLCLCVSYTFQKANLMPNWSSRIASASLMVPNAPEVFVVFGPLRLTILNAFVASARNCISSRSPNLKVRAKPRSTVVIPGLSKMLRPAVPGCPAAFCWNAAMLNHAAVTSARDRFGLSCGLPMRSARSLLLPSRLLSLPDVTVNGTPLRALMMVETPQPFRICLKTEADPL